MKVNILAAILLVAAASACASRNPKQNTASNTTTEPGRLLFTAFGNEPSWSVRVFEHKIEYMQLDSEQPLSFDYAPATKDGDAQVYQVSNQQANLALRITKTECSDGMSDMVHQYQTEVILKNGDQNRQWTGCGRYETDSRLHSIWVLEEINGKQAIQASPDQKLPNMDIDTKENRLSGFAGCNRMMGGFSNEGNQIKFGPLATTMMACLYDTYEQELLQALDAVNRYEIKDTNLYLFNNDKQILVFKKVE